MEIFTLLLSGLLSVLSGGGLFLDSLAQSQLSDELIRVEEQAVRIDNTPSYQLVRGKLERISIATKGLIIRPGLRIAALELQSDPLAFQQKLNPSSWDELRESLAQPASGAFKLVLSQADLNRAAASPQILTQIQTTLNRLLARGAGSAISYQLSDLSLELHPQNRLAVSFQLSRPRTTITPRPGTYTSNNRSRELNITLELTINVSEGKTVQLIEPRGKVNGRPMSSRLLNGFAEGISDRLDLNSLEANGILARILQLEIDEDTLELVGFFWIETKSAQLSSS